MVDVIKSDKFEEEVLRADKPVLVDIYADWCGPCKTMAPQLEALAEDIGGYVKILKIDLDEAQANGGAENPVMKLMAKHQIRGIPALLLFQGGEYIDASVGAKPKDAIKEWLAGQLACDFSAKANGPEAPSP